MAAGQEKEEELATTYLELEFRLRFPCGSPRTELSDFCQSARSRNECECQSAFRMDFFDADFQAPGELALPSLPFCACQATTPKSAWLHSDQGGNSPVVESSIFVLDWSRGYTTKLLGILSYINQPSGVFFWARDSSLRWSVPRSSLCT